MIKFEYTILLEIHSTCVLREPRNNLFYALTVFGQFTTAVHNESVSM